MNDELFPLAEVMKDSPRIIWLREHNLETVQLRNPDNSEIWVCRRKLPDGFIETPETKWSPNSIGKGATEHESICAFCEASGVTHWSGTP